ncbi:MAG: hypothetical protein B6I34_07855, partial [Anaerolineaceae bacterium 4572_32.1]
MFRRLYLAISPILIGLLLLIWAAPTSNLGLQVPPNDDFQAITHSIPRNLPTTITDKEGKFLFPSVTSGTHQVYLIENTLPRRWQSNIAPAPLKLLLNPGMAVSTRVTSRVVLEAHYQNDSIAGVVFVDLDQDGQMSAGDIGLAGVTVVDPTMHQYFVPFNDRNLWQLFSEVNQCHRAGYGPVSDTLESIVSLTASADDTQWFYDHWEDGYDTDPLSPGATTETGVLDTGAIEIFQSTVDTTDLGNPANLQYDGRDRITVVGEAASVTRMVYPSVVETFDPGVVLATAWEVPEVSEWGTEYITTIGEDLDFNGGFTDDFDYTGLEVMAAFSNTQVYRNGTLADTLDLGETYFVPGADDGAGGGGIDSSDDITATNPIQVQNFGGGCDMSYGWSSQGYTLLPVSTWD